MIGCWTGVICAIILDSMVFAPLFNSALALYGLIFFFVIVFGWLACKYYEYLLIFSSSLLGSYFFNRGVSMLVGGYPSEIDILDQFKKGTYVEIPWTLYLYIVSMVAFAVFGVIFQVRSLNKKSKNKEERKLKVNKTDDDGVELEEAGKKDYDEMTEE